MLVSLLDAWYWLALAGWFACVLSSAIIPPVVFRVIQEADPTLPRVLSVNLNNQHSTLLAGDVVRGILSVFFGLQIVCCATFLPALISKWFLIDLSGQRIVFPDYDFSPVPVCNRFYDIWTMGGLAQGFEAPHELP
ncbi:MAG: hypothetical protein KatS3mg104_0806 [Phycisphaerae bacterium]|nr:MAG: hypothetical protein KatS3mg104_0806 [Phycisphaerae bacterium]